MICIICQQEKPDGNEHVIPKSIGGSFVTKRVCRDCDNGFGSTADAGLVKHFKLETARIELQLKGNNGVVPDPMKAALRKPIDSGAEPGHQLFVSPIPNEDGKYPARTVSKVEAEVEFDGTGNVVGFGFPKFFIDKSDADKAETLIKSALRKKGVRNEETLQSISDFIIPGLQERDVPKEVPFLREQHSGGEILGIVKIAYEFAHYWLGDTWLSDPIALEMRKAVMGDKTTTGRYRIYEDGADGFLPENFDPRSHHTVQLFRSNNALFIHVRLLDVFSAYYLISENAGAYEFPEKAIVFMDVVNKRPFFLKAAVSTDVTGPRLVYSDDPSDEKAAS